MAKEPKCSAAHGSRIVFIKSFNSQTSLYSCMSPKATSRLSAGRERGVSAGSNAGLDRAGHSMQGFFVSHDFTPSLSERQVCSQADDEVPKPGAQGGQSRAERPKQFLCVRVLSTRHPPGTESPARCCSQECTEQLPAGIPAGAEPAAPTPAQKCCLH